MTDDVDDVDVAGYLVFRRGSYERRKRAAGAVLVALLAPETAQEHASVAWLLDTDLETITTLTAMINRAVYRIANDRPAGAPEDG